MNPAFSVIFLTTLIGAAQGLFLALFGVQLAGLASPEFLAAGGVVALALTVAGLVSSFFHLGRPERAWRTATMWRTSWLSREILTFGAFAGNDLGTDSGLDGDHKLLTGKQFLEAFADLPSESFRFLAVHQCRQGVDILTVQFNIELYQV